MKTVRYIQSVGVLLALFVVFNTIATEPAYSQSERKDQLQTRVIANGSASDHAKLAAHYRDEAARLTTKAHEFSEQADVLARQPALMESKQGISCQCPAHYRYFSKQFDQQAKDAQALAGEHERLARDMSQGAEQKKP